MIYMEGSKYSRGEFVINLKTHFTGFLLIR